MSQKPNPNEATSPQSNDPESMRQHLWHRLKQLTENLNRPSEVSPKEVELFLKTYPTVAADLITLRSQATDPETQRRVSELLLDSSRHLRRPKKSGTRRGVEWITEAPIILRKNWGLFAAACMVFFASFLITTVVVALSPEAAYIVVPPSQLAGAVDSYLIGFDMERPFSADTQMFGFYVINNGSIALFTFAMGIFLGIGSIYVLLFNGLSIGAICGYIAANGAGHNLLAFIGTHGAPELMAIAISGAAGMLVGFKLFNPENRQRGTTAATMFSSLWPLLVLIVVLILIAAVIEAYFSSSSLPNALKLTTAVLAWAAILGYLFLAGRQKERERELPSVAY